VIAQVERQPEQALAYADHWQHLTDELQWLDLLLQWQVAMLRAQTQPAQRLAVSRQVCIAHEEIDWLLGNEKPPNVETHEADGIRRRLERFRDRIQVRIAASLEQGIFLPLIQLAQTFGLSPFEVQTLVICLAPELRRKYDRLYAYLQDDITRKRPSIDLVLTLLCPTETGRWQARTAFSTHAPLLRAGLIHTIDDPQSPSGSSELGRFLRLDRRILDYLLGNNQLDEQLAKLAAVYRPGPSLEQVLVEPAAKTRMGRILQRYFLDQGTERRRLVVHLHGPAGVGKRELALAACAQLHCPLFCLDLELLLVRESEAEALLRLAFREGLLLQAALFLDHLDGLLGEEPKAKVALKLLSQIMIDYGWLVFLAGEKPWNPGSLFEQLVFQAIALPLPDVPLREAAWRQVLARFFPTAEADWAGRLANQFRLTPGHIRAAATLAESQCDRTAGKANISLADLYAACRCQSNQKLSELAVKIEPRQGWEDIVLPEDKTAQLQEICSQARHRYRVFGEWGFDRKLSHGKGLSVLFTGPPGTGKTMAAEVIAHELRVDLYKVDLSGVVSKYIGETEKNLSRIFQEAETSNAILFFDEADALFGKRTEISDAHDRYANIETSYLLQKMEEYEGIVILATNLRENMDEAFTRRLRFIVEFPFPDEAGRLLIWKTHFPAEAPLSDELDYDLLARKFQIAGGNIKNIVLNAAFYAAESRGEIDMEHIWHGARREFEKIGKLWSDLSLSVPNDRKD
jgi:DNA polymerase III delta prime subunit